jgi:hypothetical protein
MASVVEQYMLKVKSKKVRINRRLVAMDARQLVMLYNAYRQIVHGVKEHDYISKEPPGT